MAANDAFADAIDLGGDLTGSVSGDNIECLTEVNAAHTVKTMISVANGMNGADVWYKLHTPSTHKKYALILTLTGSDAGWKVVNFDGSTATSPPGGPIGLQSPPSPFVAVGAGVAVAQGSPTHWNPNYGVFIPADGITTTPQSKSIVVDGAATLVLMFATDSARHDPDPGFQYRDQQYAYFTIGWELIPFEPWPRDPRITFVQPLSTSDFDMRVIKDTDGSDLVQGLYPPPGMDPQDALIQPGQFYIDAQYFVTGDELHSPPDPELHLWKYTPVFDELLEDHVITLPHSPDYEKGTDQLLAVNNGRGVVVTNVNGSFPNQIQAVLFRLDGTVLNSWTWQNGAPLGNVYGFLGASVHGSSLNRDRLLFVVTDEDASGTFGSSTTRIVEVDVNEGVPLWTRYRLSELGVELTGQPFGCCGIIAMDDGGVVILDNLNYNIVRLDKDDKLIWLATSTGAIMGGGLDAETSHIVWACGVSNFYYGQYAEAYDIVTGALIHNVSVGEEASGVWWGSPDPFPIRVAALKMQDGHDFVVVPVKEGL